MEDHGIQFDGTIQVRCLVKDGNPADAVAEAIAENHPCILVAGVKRASGTPGPHGTAFALLSASRVPVLCVPPNTADTGAKSEVASEAAREVALPVEARSGGLQPRSAAQMIPKENGRGERRNRTVLSDRNRKHEGNGVDA